MKSAFNLAQPGVPELCLPKTRTFRLATWRVRKCRLQHPRRVPGPRVVKKLSLTPRALLIGAFFDFCLEISFSCSPVACPG